MKTGIRNTQKKSRQRAPRASRPNHLGDRKTKPKASPTSTEGADVAEVLITSPSLQRFGAIMRGPAASGQGRDALLDEAADGVGPLLVAGIGALAATVQHQVVAEDRRVLVPGQGQEPAEGERTGPRSQQHLARADG